MPLPQILEKVVVPPIKCQGIKTKLLPFIASSIHWHDGGKWVEPFLGSGVVAFNIEPKHALLCDTNKHIVSFYKAIQSKVITKATVREKLESMGANLSKKGLDYYYEIRERFNKENDVHDFLFLNRSCFNGLMRFNSKGGFNVPFGHKPDRFSKSYVTKICNQTENVSQIIGRNDWEFKTQSWEMTFAEAAEDDFYYLDPPYIGRNTDYYNTWSDNDAKLLSTKSASLPCKYALSMWLENKYRKNEHILNDWDIKEIKTFKHFYHIGSTESLRNEMTEALAIS